MQTLRVFKGTMKARMVIAQRVRERAKGDESREVSLIDHTKPCGFDADGLRPISAAVSKGLRETEHLSLQMTFDTLASLTVVP